MNWKLELVAIPVADADRGKAFYEQVGFTLDHDHVVNENLRFIQFTPPGSACSIALGIGLTDAPVGSARPQLVVDDARAACATLRARGIEATDVEDFPWGSFTFFSDPDGNRWSVQQLVARPTPPR